MNNKPKLRFKEFNDEWTCKTFSDSFKMLQNNTFSRDLLNGTSENATKNVHYGDVLIKYSSILDCSDNILPKITETIELDKFKEESYLVDGDIVIADTAEDYTVGKASEIINVKSKVLSGLHTIPCRPLYKFAPCYLGHYLNSNNFHDSLIPFVTGIKVSSISKSSLSKTIIKYPTIEEQEKIAEFLSKVDEIIAEREAEIKDLEQQKKGLMQKIFSQQIRFTDSNNNPYPSWEETKLNDIFIEYKNKSTIQDEYPVLTSSRQGIMLQSDYYSGDNRITGRDNIGFNILPKNYITYRSRSDDGYFTFNLNTLDFIGLISTYYPVFDTSCNNYFIVLLLNYNKHIFFKYSVGSSQKVLSYNDLKNISLKLPCLEEQEKIANVLSKMDELIEEKKALLSDWQQFKKGLLQQMFV